MESTWREPGETDRFTPGAMVLPFKMAATFSISAREELVQEPMHTWSTLVSFRVDTSTTLSGLWGQAISGVKVLKSMGITRS